MSDEGIEKLLAALVEARGPQAQPAASNYVAPPPWVQGWQPPGAATDTSDKIRHGVQLVSGIATALLVAAVSWMGSTMIELKQDIAVLKAHSAQQATILERQNDLLSEPRLTRDDVERALDPLKRRVEVLEAHADQAPRARM